MKRVIVVGGGASGLMAACAAARNGNAVTLIEKNEKLGKKIYITGKGRGNVTNDTDVRTFLENVVTNPKFLQSCLSSFTPQDTERFMEENGTRLKTERGGRVFPVSDHASDITRALKNACASAGAEIRLNERVTGIGVSGGAVTHVATERGEYPCDCAIVCTGGMSYPATGSTGDGYAFARACGHRVSRLYPALTGIGLKGGIGARLAGLSLRNVRLTASRGGKQAYGGMGEMLFTHYGISGPLVLTLSSLLAREDLAEYSLSVDLKPALSPEELDRRLVRELDRGKDREMANVAAELLPAKLIRPLLGVAGVSAEKQAKFVTRPERQRLGATLKDFRLSPVSARGFEEAIVTSGGIDVREIDPRTMESWLVKGLRFCGEVLDVDALTGGFNMQIAFSTGYAAGNSVR